MCSSVVSSLCAVSSVCLFLAFLSSLCCFGTVNHCVQNILIGVILKLIIIPTAKKRSKVKHEHPVDLILWLFQHLIFNSVFCGWIHGPVQHLTFHCNDWMNLKLHIKLDFLSCSAQLLLLYTVLWTVISERVLSENLEHSNRQQKSHFPVGADDDGMLFSSARSSYYFIPTQSSRFEFAVTLVSL